MGVASKSSAVHAGIPAARKVGDIQEATLS